MGRRSRRREDAPIAARPAGGRAANARATPSGSKASERPKAPWHPFPLAEICVLAGIGLLITGFLNAEQRSGRAMLVAGMVLASLAGLETALREHLAGFRSHSTLLAAAPAVLVAGGCYFARAPWPVLVVAAALAFGAAFVPLRNAFRRRSGGLSFKIR